MTTAETKKVPADWKCVVDSDTISRCISRITYEILEKNRDIQNLAIVGIRTGGEFLGRRIKNRIKEIEGLEVPFGVVDITLYRDDLSHSSSQPELKGTDLRFSVSGSRIVLVDDVLYTGRTVRAALDAITDFGRPSCVELAVLCDRGHRELPIRPDYVGKNLPTERNEFVRVRLREMNYQDGVYLIRKKK
ncbi:MAG: bifunctional pyr operon transcriptional regulator/uracil phosphoribosyltransferase PyrR [Candidatus Dadabacteria bacterium]|nr:MAG: bifunctional pyr operon transcriptional regulator/uracil phosphoribosyltransferase PyrR [Candidatus Dadabacteria bacterium]